MTIERVSSTTVTDSGIVRRILTLAQVRVDGTWLVGQVVSGLPPEWNQESTALEPIKLRMVVETEKALAAVADELSGRQGLVARPVFVELPLGHGPIIIDEWEAYSIVEVDLDRPPQGDEPIARYLALVKRWEGAATIHGDGAAPPAKEEAPRRTRLTS
jgi:hypothetical protein